MEKKVLLAIAIMAMFIGFSAVSAIGATVSTVENTNNPVPCPSYSGGDDLGFIFAKVDGTATSWEKPTSFLEDGIIFVLFGTEIHFEEVTISGLLKTKSYSDMTVWVIGEYHQTGEVHINTIFAAADTEK